MDGTFLTVLISMDKRFLYTLVYCTFTTLVNTVPIYDFCFAFYAIKHAKCSTTDYCRFASIQSCAYKTLISHSFKSKAKSSYLVLLRHILRAGTTWRGPSRIIPSSISLTPAGIPRKSSPRPSLIPYLNLIRSQEIHR